MTINDTFSASERAPNHSLTALLLLADPASVFLERDRLTAIVGVALRPGRPTTRTELVLLRDCAKDLEWLRRSLKHAITLAYAWGVMGAATTQRLIDRFELWSD